jgi:hypothetical protein
MRRHVALAFASCALLTACGPKSHLDLQMRSVQVNVHRLVTPAVTIVPPAPGPVPAPLPSYPPVTTFLPPTPVTPPPVVSPPPACPAAGSFAVPARPATPLVEGYPAAASYVQHAQGGYGKAEAITSLSGTVAVTVVRQAPSATAAGQRVDSWRVQRRAGKATSVEVYQLVHSSTADAAITPGIYLVGLAWDDPVRGRLTFQPVGNGVLVLPDPVEVAQQPVEGVAAQYAGSATDPQSLTTLNVVRNVLGRQRVDVCGELVDTFTVEMTGVLVTRDAQWQVGWTQQLATAYGGIDVASAMTLTSPASGLSWTRTLRATTVPAVPR